MKTLTPPVCLNCEHLGYVESQDASEPITGRCTWGPTHASIVDTRVHSCSQRKPLNEPRYMIPINDEEVEPDAEELADADA